MMGTIFISIQWLVEGEGEACAINIGTYSKTSTVLGRPPIGLQFSHSDFFDKLIFFMIMLHNYTKLLW